MKKLRKGKLRLYNTFSFKVFITFSAIMLTTMFIITVIIIGEVSKKMVEQELRMNRQIVEKIAEYIDDNIKSARKTIQDIYYSDDETQETINDMINGNINKEYLAEYILKKQRFEKFFTSALYNDDDILSITVLGKNSEEAYIFSKKWSTVLVDTLTYDYPWVKDLQSSFDALTIIPSYRAIEKGKERSESKFVYSFATNIFSTENFKGSMGVMIINFDTKMIENAFEIYEDDIKGNLMVFSENGSVIYDYSEKYYEKEYPNYSLISEVESNEFDNTKNMVSVSKTNSLNMKVVNITPKAEFFKEINTLKKRSYIFLLISTLSVLVMFYYVSLILAKRISIIEKAMEEVQNGNLEVRIPKKTSSSKDEIGLIASQFNIMCEKLYDYINKSYISEIRLKETEIMALQSQINPHFIYNTLEIIRVKSVINNNHDVASMIYRLSNLFRKSFKTSNIVRSLRDEIEYCKDYLELNKIRFHERMNVEYEIDDSILDYGVLKLILQPIVENIIVHVIQENSKVVDILIKAYKNNNDIVIFVKDTGGGLGQDKIDMINNDLEKNKNNIKSSHIGLTNVNHRLKIIFGERYGLVIKSIENKSTCVKINLPAMSVESMNILIGKREVNKKE